MEHSFGSSRNYHVPEGARLRIGERGSRARVRRPPLIRATAHCGQTRGSDARHLHAPKRAPSRPYVSKCSRPEATELQFPRRGPTKVQQAGATELHIHTEVGVGGATIFITRLVAGARANRHNATVARPVIYIAPRGGAKVQRGKHTRLRLTVIYIAPQLGR